MEKDYIVGMCITYSGTSIMDSTTKTFIHAFSCNFYQLMRIIELASIVEPKSKVDNKTRSKSMHHTIGLQNIKDTHFATLFCIPSILNHLSISTKAFVPN
jgi:hypothetical protein